MNGDSSLPGVLSEIADVTDANTAIMIAEAYGGSRVQIPAYAKERDHWLTDLVGYEKAVAISDYFRVITGDGRAVGIYLQMPSGSKSKTAIQRRRIERGFLEGKSYDRIAREVGVSRMTVIRHKKRLRQEQAPPNERQLNLFNL